MPQTIDPATAPPQEPTPLVETAALAMLPPAWRDLRNRNVLVTGFHCIRMSGVADGPVTLDLDDIRIILLRGHLRFLAGGVLLPLDTDDGQIECIGSPLQQQTSPRGSYALVLCLSDEGATNEAAQRERTLSAVGLARTLWGANFAWRRVCQYSVAIPSGDLTVLPPGTRNPMAVPPVDTSQASRDLLADTFHRVHALPAAARRECELAFRWHAEALTEGVHDSFLKTWFAIEAISMNGNSDIAPLREMLAAAYGCTPAEIMQTLGLGQVYGLRCRVVHEGQLPPTHGAVLDHMQALFRDTVHARLGMPCGRYAQATAVEALPELIALARQYAR